MCNRLYNLGVPYPTNMEVLTQLLNKVDQLNICIGGPSIYVYKNIQPVCAIKDVNNKWRHRLCSLITPKGTICEHCSKLDNTLRCHFDRKMKQKCKPRIIMSPTKKKAFDVLKKAVRLQAQNLKRYKSQIADLKSHFKDLQNKMKNLENSEVQEVLKKYNIPETQVLLQNSLSVILYIFSM